MEANLQGEKIVAVMHHHSVKSEKKKEDEPLHMNQGHKIY
jgi:hypothetical protein